MTKTKGSPAVTLTIILSLLFSVVAGPLAAPRAKAKPESKRTSNDAATKSEAPALARFTRDLTQLARNGKLEPVNDHDAEISQAIQILSNSQQNNPVLVSESGANAAEVVEGLAQRIAAGDVPESLRQTRLYSLDLDALLAGVKTSAELESRLKAVLDEVSSKDKNSILFVDEFHQFVGTRAAQTVSETLAGAAERGELRLMGATSRGAFDEHIASDTTLKGLFQEVSLDGNTNSEDVGSSEAQNKGDYDFVGDKVSADLRELMQNAGSKEERARVILQTDDTKNAGLRKLLRQSGVKIMAEMPNLGALDVELPVGVIEQIAANDKAKHLSLDRKMAFLGHIDTTTGAYAARETGLVSNLLGVLTNTTLDGTGVTIAVLDSSIFTSHHSFAGKDGNKRINVNVDFTGTGMNTDDPYGHGTHVAGLAAGSRGRPGDSEDAKYLTNYGGVAPNATIINLRVLDAKGVGTSSGLLKALDWLLVNRTKYNIKVVNMSLGAPAIESYKNDPLCRAARKLVDAGVVVVAAAGNNGKNAAGQKLYGQIHAPGNEPSVITVGASNTLGTDARNDDIIASFSSRGPTRSYWTDESGIKHYDNLIKPDLVAPGNKLISAQGKNNMLVATNASLDVPATDKDDKDLMYLSGTSMAAPVVSGAVALMLQANPKLTPNMVKMILMYTSQPLKGYNMLEQGTGQLNVEGAVRLAKLVRKDLTASTPQGDPLLTTSNPPTPETTIGGYTFTWAQGIVLKYSYASGVELITKYQDIYDLGVVIGDGGVVSDGVVVGGGVVVGESIVMSDGVVIGDYIMTSDGVVIGDGTVFCSTDILQGNGVVIGDNVVLGDGVVIGDGGIVGDGVVVGDSVVQAMSAMLGGDDGPGMK